jgi:hypothetical protein
MRSLREDLLSVDALSVSRDHNVIGCCHCSFVFKSTMPNTKNVTLSLNHNFSASYYANLKEMERYGKRSKRHNKIAQSQPPRSNCSERAAS